MTRTIRIATRTSPMALHQAEQVAAAIHTIDPATPTQLVKVTTAGDRWMGDLATLGGKGAFTKEIDHALLTDDADLAVHCLKDIPGDVPVTDGIAFAGYLPREDIHDALITRFGTPIADLPDGAVIGTSSVRRIAQLRLLYPHLHIKPLRGNVTTRLTRLDEGHVDVLIAAVAGLRRLNETHRITEILPLEAMCPPVGAGIIALQGRADDTQLLDLGAHLTDPDTQQQADAERAMLHALQGHCNSPIAGYATTEPAGRLSLHGKVFNADGSQWIDSHHWGVPDEPQALGFFVGADLLRQGARALINVTAH